MPTTDFAAGISTFSTSVASSWVFSVSISPGIVYFATRSRPEAFQYVYKAVVYASNDGPTLIMGTRVEIRKLC